MKRKSTEEEKRIDELQRLNAELLEACIRAMQIFQRLADDGKYPDFLLQQNGGEGFEFLTSAIAKAKGEKL